MIGLGHLVSEHWYSPNILKYKQVCRTLWGYVLNNNYRKHCWRRDAHGMLRPVVHFFYRSLPQEILGILVAGILVPGGAFSATGTTTQTLNATISPVGRLVLPASTTLKAAATAFQPFTGTLAVSYEVRTTSAGGGSITLRVSSDFTPAGGPSASSGSLKYTCGAAGLGTSCSGTQTASTTAQTPVLTVPASACTGGGGACSGQDPNTINLNFTLTDQPAYATGTYTAVVTFVISAT
jgi:hypothetical protein